jgi:polyisoprenoid-binding protein YceI
MGNAKWESDIKAASWFDVKQFPNITFKTTSVKKTGDDTYEATGDLTLHGVTKSVTVTLTKTGEGKGMQGETRIGYNCTFKVKRSDYGMTTYVGPIGDEVTLMVNIEAIKQ